MARRHEAPDAIEEITSAVDRMAEWVAQHRQLSIAVVALVLVGAAVVGVATTLRARSESQAAAAVARVDNAYRAAMGAAPDALDVPEPANPELGRRLRAEYAERFAALAGEHAGTSAAIVAELMAGNLRAASGDPEAAFEAWEAARAAAPGSSPLRALVLLRLASAYEEAGRLEEAAAAFEQAGDVETFPGRYHALAAAARNYANGGDPARAVALLERIEAEAPPAAVPEHVRSRLREIRSQQQRREPS